MTRRKLSDEQKDARLTSRAAARAARQAAVDANVEFHRASIARAEKRALKRAEKRRKADEKARARLAKAEAKDRKRRGVTRPVGPVPHTVGKHGTPIDSTPGQAIVHGRRIVGNHDYRRQVGERSYYGRQGMGLGGRKPRRRELPGAVAKRLARAQAGGGREWK